MKRFPLILPLNSYYSLINNPFVCGADNPIHQRLIPLILSHLTSDKTEKKVIEMGGCGPCFHLYPLIEEIHIPEEDLPDLPEEERYKLYSEIHSKLQSNKIYIKFCNVLYGLYNGILKKYEKTHSLEQVYSDVSAFSSILLLNFQFRNSLHKEVALKVLEKGFFEPYFRKFKSGTHYKLIHFTLCGVPIYNYHLWKDNETGEEIYSCFDHLYNYAFSMDDSVEAVVCMSYVPVYIEFKK